MNDEDRHLIQMAVLDGSLDESYLSNTDVLEIEFKLMEVLINRKQLENKAVVEPTSRLQ